MNASSKQRIIGALVLFALAMIFFPAVFDLSGERSIDTTPQIPPAPKVEPVTIPEPVRPEGIVPPKPQEQAFQPSINAEDAVGPEPEEPSLSENGLPQAWVIQVGSFKDSEKAEQLVARLQGDGFKGYSRSINTSQSTLYRVFVGPKIRKANAVTEQQRIEKMYGLETLMLRFEP